MWQLPLNLRRPARAAVLALGAVLNLLAPAAAPATAQLQEGMDYPVAAATPVTGRPPWLMASSGAAPAASTAYIGIYAGDLTGTTSPALAGLTNTLNPEAHLQISKAGSSSRTYFRSLGTAFTGGTLYCSFLLNVAVNPATSDEILGEWVPAVPGGSYPANPATTDPLLLHARQGADASHFNLGLQSLGGTVSWAAASLADNTDYLVVVAYTFGAGQPGQLFINPPPGSPAPAASATATKGATPEPANLGTVLFWESATATSGTYNYDVMRADANWTNVTPAAGAAGVTNSAPPMNLLFLGDSLLGISTDYSNNIPAILLNLAQSLGDALTYTRIANSSWYLANFATNTAAIADIQAGNFNLVILQDQSQEPSLPGPRNTSMFPAARTLNTFITNRAEKTMFYETWGHLDGDTTANCDSYDLPAQYLDCDGGFGSYLSMTAALREGYTLIANPLGAAIAPVGLAWATVRKNQPDLNLYILNDSLGDRHPNSYGAYLAAAVFYSAIFGRSPEGSTYYSTNDASSAIYLQQVAAQTVLQDPFAPDVYGFGTNGFYWARRWPNFTNPPTAPANTVLISGASAVPSPSVRVDANAGAAGNLWLGTFDTNYNLAGQGRLYLAAGGALVVTGALVAGVAGKGFVQQNGGALVVGGPLWLGQQTNSFGQYTLTNGNLNARQILAGAGTGAFNFQGGQLTFTQFGGTNQPLNLWVQGGTLALTNSAGPAQVWGNFTNGSSATVAMQLGGTNAGLNIHGTATLGGNLVLTEAPGWQPAASPPFNLLTANTILGNFATVTGPAPGANGWGLATALTATALVATAVNFTPTLQWPATTAGGFQFSLNGRPGTPYVVQSSTNLVNWLPVITNTAPFTFQPTLPPGTRQWFYRAVYAP